MLTHTTHCIKSFPGLVLALAMETDTAAATLSSHLNLTSLIFRSLHASVSQRKASTILLVKAVSKELEDAAYHF